MSEKTKLPPLKTDSPESGGKPSAAPSDGFDYYGLNRLFPQERNTVRRMKSMQQIYEEEIEDLQKQRDYTRRLLQQHLRYHSVDVDRLNEKVGDYTYRIKGYQRLLRELRERREQRAKIKKLEA